jgi:hypothetical protein
MTKPRAAPCMIAMGLVLGLSACTNPYDPVQRFVGGGLIGAGSGAAIGAAAAGGHGAALGAAVGGAVGAVTGLLTTPPPPAYHGYYNHRHYASNGRRHYAARSAPRTASTNASSGYRTTRVIPVASAAHHSARWGVWLALPGGLTLGLFAASVLLHSASPDEPVPSDTPTAARPITAEPPAEDTARTDQVQVSCKRSVRSACR